MIKIYEPQHDKTKNKHGKHYSISHDMVHSFFLKILRKIEILTSIKGHNSIEKFGKISCVSHNTAYTKFHQNPSICSQEEKHIFTSIKGHNSVFINEYSPSAIPNHSSLISMFTQSLKKIGQKLLKLESGNEVLTDRGTDRHSNGFEGIT